MLFVLIATGLVATIVSLRLQRLVADRVRVAQRGRTIQQRCIRNTLINTGLAYLKKYGAQAVAKPLRFGLPSQVGATSVCIEVVAHESNLFAIVGTAKQLDDQQLTVECCAMLKEGGELTIIDKSLCSTKRGRSFS